MSRVLVILGGCGGIGRELAHQAGAAGYQLILLDLPASIERHQPDHPAFGVDARDPASLRAALAHLPDTIDGFVNLAGFMGENQPLLDTDEASWAEIISGNLDAVFYAARVIGPLVRAGGALVLTSSGLGHFARPGYGPYAVSKAGISAVTRQLALEMAPHIRVNAVAPAAVDTAFLRGGTGRSDEKAAPRFDIDAYAATIPLGRIAVPQDIAGPVLFLLSEAAGYITGQTLHINGGSFMA